MFRFSSPGRNHFERLSWNQRLLKTLYDENRPRDQTLSLKSDAKYPELYLTNKFDYIKKMHLQILHWYQNIRKNLYEFKIFICSFSVFVWRVRISVWITSIKEKHIIQLSCLSNCWFFYESQTGLNGVFWSPCIKRLVVQWHDCVARLPALTVQWWYRHMSDKSPNGTIHILQQTNKQSILIARNRLVFYLKFADTHTGRENVISFTWTLPEYFLVLFFLSSLKFVLKHLKFV